MILFFIFKVTYARSTPADRGQARIEMRKAQTPSRLAPSTTKKHKTFACALYTYHYNRLQRKCQSEIARYFPKNRKSSDICIKQNRGDDHNVKCAHQ
jgi:hypothetical protein